MAGLFTLLGLSGAWASAPLPEPPPGPTTVVLFSPLGPAIALGFHLAPFEFGVDVSALDLNLRTHYAVSDRWGFTAQIDFTRAELLVQAAHAGVRVGPRMSLGRRGLVGWGLSPFVLAGTTHMSAGDTRLADWATVGLGAEIGRVFIKNRLVFELGMGAYWSTNLAYRSHSETLADTGAPEPVLPVMPLLTASVGCAF